MFFTPWNECAELNGLMLRYARVLLLFLLLAVTARCSAQGTVRGKVTDETGETVIGATVVLKSNPGQGTITDLDGNYSLRITSTSQETLRVSMVGYQPQDEIIRFNGQDVVVRNFVLRSSINQMKEVEITSKAVRARDYYVEKMKQNSSTTLDYISSETMKKTGDANVVAAVSRVSGVSTNGGFITVRGIGDRYVRTAINGAAIPTLDPFTNNIRLDIIPSNLVDNVIITKTASPDLPANWSGASISIETKDFPEQLTVNVETSIGYNPQSGFREVITSERSRTDWLGFDSDLRDRNHSVFAVPQINPSLFQQFSAIGLADYYAGLGVNQSNWQEGTSLSDTYYKLGLIQLGLLAPALFNDELAFQDARAQFESGPYPNLAFRNLNAAIPAIARSFPNNWDTERRIAPLNFSQSFSIGNQVTLFGKPLGFLAGLRYSSLWQYDPVSAINRAAVAMDEQGNLVDRVASAQVQQTGRETNGWSALFNLAYRLSNNNSLSLLFMPNILGVNNVRASEDRAEPASYVITKSQFYEQRRQLVYQLKSENYFPSIKLKADVSASYTQGNSKAPDFKNVQYLKDPISNQYQIGGSIGDGLHRYYRYLDENLFDSKVTFELPLMEKAGLPRKVRFGSAWQRLDRLSDQYDYFINVGPFPSVVLTSDDLTPYFKYANFDIRSYIDPFGATRETIDLYYTQLETPANNTFGYSDVFAAFLMTDYTLFPRLRISGGLRLEQATIKTDVVEYDKAAYPRNDPRRNYSNGFPAANPGLLDELTLLPSINLVFKLRDNENTPVNLRANYSRTLARPSIRELSDVALFDYEYRSFVYGNSDLKSVRIDNYDLRGEAYFESGDNISISAFYKDFRNHIELVKSIGFTWQNVERSNVVGVELEGRKQLGKKFEFRSNMSFIYSRTTFARDRVEINNGVKVSIPLDTVRRPMFGQSPYVINAILTYNLDSLGLSFSASYNIQGPRLVVAADVMEIPDVYELPRHQIDLKATKTLGKHLTLGVTVRDLLNTPIRRSYNYPGGWNLDFDRYRFGTTYNLSLSYRL